MPRPDLRDHDAGGQRDETVRKPRGAHIVDAEQRPRQTMSQDPGRARPRGPCSRWRQICAVINAQADAPICEQFGFPLGISR